METSPATKPTPGAADTGALFVDAARDFQKLVEAEWRMAKAEMTLEYTKVKKAAVQAAVGIGSASVAAMVLAMGAAFGLAKVPGLENWSAFLIVGAVMAVAAGVLFVIASRETKNVNMIPDRALASITDRTSPDPLVKPEDR